MRKNGVNRQLEPIEGGACAPQGFAACGRENLALIVGEKRFPAAAVFSQCPTLGSPVRVSKRHVKSGYAQAIFVNSGEANVFQDGGEEQAKEICVKLAKLLRCDFRDVLIASTGKISSRFSNEKILAELDILTDGLGVSHKHSVSAARAIMTTDRVPKQISFAFDVGDYRCKLGGIYKGGARVCPNMATTLCFLTTDVNITPQMLQKALSSAVNETLNSLNADGVSSPNDTVCILSSCKAGNYLISEPDSEYDKFFRALKSTLVEVCVDLIKDGGENCLLRCLVNGAKSKREAREVAKSVVSSSAFKDGLRNKNLQVETLLYTLLQTKAPIRTERLEVFLEAGEMEIALISAGRILSVSKTVLLRFVQGDECRLRIDLNEGNYSATAYGSLEWN